MSSRAIYLSGAVIFIGAVLGSRFHEDLFGLMLPAGSCLVAGAFLNRGRGRVETQPGEPFAVQPRFIRGAFVFVGCVWAVLGAHALIT